MQDLIVWNAMSLLVGVALFVVTYLPARGRLGINGFAGIRLPPLVRSQAAWRAGHAAALPWAAALLAVCVLASLGSIGWELVQHDPNKASVPCIVAFVLVVVGLVPLCVAAVRGANRA